MTTAPEAWWERLIRALGGWGLAALVVWKYPLPAEEIAWTEASIRWGVYAALIVFCVSVAHSTAAGIVLGNMGRWWSFLRRGGKDRRDREPSTSEQTQIRPIRRRSDRGK